MPSTPTKSLETFPNPQSDRDYIIEIRMPEFTCLCPKTGQPDFATLHLEYVPDKLCVELKSLKLYIWAFRNEGHFHEKVTNSILNDLVEATQPRYMRLRAEFNVRGGVYTDVTVEYRKNGWTAPPPPPDYLPRVAQDAARDASADAAGAKAPTGARAKAGRGAGKHDDAANVVTVTPTPIPPKRVRDIYIGLDLGTTGCRAAAIDSHHKLLAQAETSLPASAKQARQITQDPTDWWKAVSACLKQLLAQVDTKRVHRIAVAGTSSTLLLCDKNGQPVSPGLMHNDRRAEAEAERVVNAAGDHPAAFGPNSGLAKLLWLNGTKIRERAAHALHQADWISNRLAGRYGHSDYHNCLKLGFDEQDLKWPTWLATLDLEPSVLPEPHAPGDVIGPISAETATAFGLPPDTEVVAGTTDGIAAFLSAGATELGSGVTVLSTNLVLKLLTDQRITSRANGAYSHRLGRLWLAGGVSNSGGNVLLQYFTIEQMRQAEALIDPDHPTDMNYYPLPDLGERFPLNDPKQEPKLEPLPGDSTIFMQGMLEGIARIEAQGYAVLADLGAKPLKALYSTGGGAHNQAWARIRGNIIGIKPKAPKYPSIACGAALVAAGIVQKAYA